MSVLDGKYEILRQQPVDDHQTLFRATAPDGEPVRIVWFDLAPDQEGAFERYRRVLRRLARDGDTLLRDVVSRPGAHYVVWDDPGDAPRVEHEPWAERLQAYGLDPAAADVRRVERRAQLTGLSWNGTVLPPLHSPAPAAPEAPAEPRRTPWWPATPQRRADALALLLVLLALGLLSAGWQRGHADRVVAVPDVLGEEAQAAVDALHAAGLSAEPVATPSEEAPGTVLALEPAVGTELRPRRSVRLTYAAPPGQLEPAAVPRLDGLEHPDEVEAALAEAGLDLGRVARIGADVPAGVVLAQRPAADTERARGDEVDLLVSTGPSGERTFVPDLVGLPLEEARALARLAGLPPDRVRVDRIPDPQRPAGEVLTQSLAPYRPVAVDRAALRLGVAAGPEPDAEGGAPDLVGLPAERAEDEAEDAGLEVRRTFLAHRGLPEGVVLQDPAPGAAADGSVTLTVNAHPIPVPQPEVQARVLRPGAREVPYRFLVEPGIPEQTAEVWAEPLSGEPQLVERRTARGGEFVEGEWRTREPGLVRFELRLNGVPYAETTVSP